MNDSAGPLMPAPALFYADAEITDIKAFLAAIHTAADRLSAHIICINADKVAGRLHLKTALSHACRTWFVEKNPVARSFEMEMLLWTAATRQTSVAARFGAQNGKMPLWIVVVPAPENAGPVISALPGLTVHTTIPAAADEIDAEKRRRLMRDFSVGETELATVGDERLPELVAERIALSAVYR